MDVLKKILIKILYGLLVVVLVTIVISSLIFLGQVDPARLTFGQRVDVETVESKREQLGLNKTLFQQLTSYLGDLSVLQYVEKDKFLNIQVPSTKLLSTKNHFLLLKAPYLRESYQNGRSVSSLISEAFPLTFLLAISSFGFALIVGITLGIISALLFSSFWDKLILTCTSLGYSLPSYVIAMVIAIVFAYYLQRWTGLNIQGSIYELDELGNDVVVWKNLLLPAIALGIRPLSIITQITRSAMLDTLSSPYIRTALAKGLSQTQVILKHAFPNALNPIGTAVSGWFASLLAGAFFVETVFNFKGLGSLTVNALLNYDLPLILGCIIFTSMLFVIINILTDVFYLVVDPRNRT